MSYDWYLLIALAAWLGMVLSFFESNRGAYERGHRNRIWLTVMGLFMGVFGAACILLVAG